MKPLLLILVSVFFASISSLACGCDEQPSYCRTSSDYNDLFFARVDSVRFSGSVYLTILDSIRGQFSVGEQIIVEDDQNDIYGVFSLCFGEVGSRLNTGDSIILTVYDSVRIDSSTGRNLYLFLPHICLEEVGFVRVTNGRVLDRGGCNQYSPGNGPVINYTIDTAYNTYRSFLANKNCTAAVYDTIVSVRQYQLPEKVLLVRPGDITLNLQTESGDFTLYNLAGQKISDNRGQSISTANLITGIYIVEFKNSDGFIRKKFYVH